jgi:outer membrane immunogenic protein
MYPAQSRFISNVAAPLHCLMELNSNVQSSFRGLTMSVVRKIAASIGVIAGLLGAPALAGTVAQTPPPPVFSWGGFYVGLNAGGLCARIAAEPGTFATTFGAADPQGFVDFNDPIGALGQYPKFLGPKCGFIGGGQIGYNWQSTNWVWGVEHDIQGTTLRASDNRSFPAAMLAAGFFAANTEQASSKLKALGTFRGRAGLLATPMLLIYGGRVGLRRGQQHDFDDRNSLCPRRRDSQC